MKNIEKIILFFFIISVIWILLNFMNYALKSYEANKYCESLGVKNNAIKLKMDNFFDNKFVCKGINNKGFLYSTDKINYDTIKEVKIKPVNKSNITYYN